jgi:hypothetical protein
LRSVTSHSIVPLAITSNSRPPSFNIEPLPSLQT